MKGPYFGGTKVESGVKRLSAETFKQFVQNCIYTPVQIQMSRGDFNAMTVKERDQMKNGPYFVACSYDYDEGPRNDSAAVSFHLVILDMDEGPFIRAFFESPETFMEHLHPYNFAVYTTAKHTPEAPRLKVVVDIESTDPANHHRFVNAVIDRLAIPRNFKGTTESHTLSLPAFRPVQFLGEDFTAVVASNTDGIPMSLSDLPEATDDEQQRVYRCTALADPEASLAYLPVPGLTVEDIREPLFTLSPDMLYHPWLYVAMSLKHQFSNSEEEAQAAYELWDEWSATGSKYQGSDETYRKWRSATPYAKFRAPRTIKSLFFDAAKAGWKNDKVATKIETNVKDWIEAQTDGNILTREGTKRIADMPFQNATTEEILIMALQAKLKTLTGSTIDKGTLRKQVTADRRAERTEKVREEKPGWILPFCFVGPENLFFNVVTGDTYKPEAFDNTFSRHLTPAPDPNSNDPASAIPIVKPSAKALNEVQIPVVHGYTYAPHRPNEMYFDDTTGRRMLNTFRLTSFPEADDERADLAGRLFNTLLSAVVGDPEQEGYLRDFFAYTVQYPGKKIRWAPFVQGVQGSGKGTLVDCLRSAIGFVNAKLVTADAINSTFTEWREGSMFVYLDEIKSPGSNRYELVNRLKDCITNSHIMVSQKFKDIRNIENVTNYMLSTNNRDALVLEDGDRRYQILISPIQSHAQVLALNATGLLQKVHAFREKYPGAFRSFFLNHKIAEDFPVNGPAPITRFRAEMIEDSKNNLQLAIEGLIEDDRYPLIGDDVIDYEELDMLTKHEQMKNGRLSKYLRELGYSKLGVYELEGRRRTLWTHDRNHFEEVVPADELVRIRLNMMPEI
jgi:hypothetical protein